MPEQRPPTSTAAGGTAKPVTSAGGGSDNPVAVSATGGDSNRPTRTATPRRDNKGSQTLRIRGVRKMKEYPVDRDELLTLGGVGVLATLCFSGGGTYLNRAFDIEKDLAFAQDLPAPVRAKWTEKAEGAEFFGWVLIAIGAAALVGFSAKIVSIVWSTKHEDN